MSPAGFARTLTTLLVSEMGLVGFAAAGEELPEALKKAYESRRALRTGRIDWSERDELRPHVGVPEPLTFFKTSRFTPGESLQLNHGDPNGVLLYDPDGRPAPVIGQKAAGTLIDDDHCWRYLEESIDAEAFPRGRRTAFGSIQMRTLGFTTEPPIQDLETALWKRASRISPPEEFSEQIEGNLHIVTAKTNFGETRFWIDASKGWSVIRTANLDGHGKIISECRCKVAELDGAWFPEEALFYYSSYRNGQEPHHRIAVMQAEFNRADHPEKLRPEDIGIETGIAVTEFDADDMDKRNNVFWDGGKLIQFEEFVARLKSGELKRGPNAERILKEHESLPAVHHELTQEELDKQVLDFPCAPDGSPLLPDLRRAGALQNFLRFLAETRWEAYTRRFTARFTLDEDQAQKAWLICAECQSKAAALLMRNEAKISAIERDYRDAPAGPAGREKRIAAQDEIRAFLSPIENIFEKELKPRLEKLPTRGQRATNPTSASESQPIAPARR